MPDNEPLKNPNEDINRENLGTEGAVTTLGAIAAASLKTYGQATFVMRDDGGVAFANPAHVHVHPQAIEDMGDRPFRYKRPILGDGRPNFVAWKDGILWEVEFSDDDAEPKSGS